MSRRSTTRKVTRRTLGVGFLAFLLLVCLLTYASFNKTFTAVDKVVLRTSHIGLQLNEHADVKLRGMIVGEVREIDVDKGGGARLELAMEPEAMKVVPAEVTARILPKTLFGEKYVDLIPPRRQSGKILTAGATIGADRSRVATELEEVLDDIYPLLRTIKPEKLNGTLNAMATALEGRGEKLGDNLVRLNRYLGKVDPHVKTLTQDLRELAAVSDVYNDATPDLARLLRNSTKTSRTIVEKERVLDAFLVNVTDTSKTAREFLDTNDEALIEIGEVSRPTLDLLERYSPQYPCLIEALAKYIPRFNDMFGGGEHFEGSAPAQHLTLELVPQTRGYSRDDKPAYVDNRGPGCRSLPNPPYSQKNPGPGGGVGTGMGKQPGPGDRAVGVDDGNEGPARQSNSAAVGSDEEREVLRAILAPTMRESPEDVPDIATLLLGSMARGTEVNLK